MIEASEIMNISAREAQRRNLKRMLAIGARDPSDLIRICKDKRASNSKKYEAAALLGTTKLLQSERPQAVGVLIDLLKSSDERLRISAALSLGLTGDKSAVEPLMLMASKSSNDDARLVAIHALGLIGDRRAQPMIRDCLYRRDEPKTLRADAAEALSLLGKSKDSVKVLVESLRDSSPEVRLFSTYALGIIGGRRTIPNIEGLVSDRAVVKGYGSVGDEAKLAIRRITARSSKRVSKGHSR